MKKPRRMSATRFHQALLDLKLDTYNQAAATIGIGRRSLVRYGIGTSPVPLVLELLLESWLANGGVPAHRKQH